MINERLVENQNIKVNNRNVNKIFRYFSSLLSLFSSQEGFTLIELLIVLAIIGVLSSFLLANLIGAKAHARDAQRKSDMRQMQAAFEMYRADQGSYPPQPLPACGSGLVNGGTTYMQKIPCDPLNSGQYVYSYTNTGAGYTLTACLENVNDAQKDKVNSPNCSGTSNWSYTLTNP